MKGTPQWTRLLWGIKLTSGSGLGSPMLLGERWHHPNPPRLLADTPSRALLFAHRAEAREWCAKQNAEWRSREDRTINKWRVRPVRVVETVAETPP